MVLIVDNVRWAMVIDETALTKETFHVSSRNLRRIALDERNVAISGRLVVFYTLAHRIGGARIVVPEQLAYLTWYLERVGRLQVVVELSALRVDPTRVDKLRGEALASPDWFVKGRTRASRIWGKFHIQPDANATEYVLGTTPLDRELFVLPRDVFEANRDGVGPVPP